MNCNNANMTNANINGGQVIVRGGSNRTDLLRVESADNSGFTYIQPIGAGFVNSSGLRVDIGASTSDGSVDISDGKGNYTTIGTRGIQSAYTYNNTVSSQPNLYIQPSGSHPRYSILRTTNVSSKRYKKDIKELTNEDLKSEKLYEIPIKQFKYKEEYLTDKNDKRYNKDLIGFIAEEVEKIYPVAIDYITDENGNQLVDNWNSRYIIPPMLELIQKQHKDIEQLKEEIKKLKEEK